MTMTRTMTTMRMMTTVSGAHFLIAHTMIWMSLPKKRNQTPIGNEIGGEVAKLQATDLVSPNNLITNNHNDYHKYDSLRSYQIFTLYVPPSTSPTFLQPPLTAILAHLTALLPKQTPFPLPLIVQVSPHTAILSASNPSQKNFINFQI